MPNHISNFIKFTGVGADRVMKSLASETVSEQIFDFNKIVPEPENIGNGWYDWRCDNWGTKWNAYDITPPQYSADGKEASIQFLTAWSPPEEVLTALSLQYPNLEISCQYFDEDIPNCGDFTLKNGELLAEYCPEDVNKGIEYHCQNLCGGTPDEFGWIKDKNGDWIWNGEEEY